MKKVILSLLFLGVMASCSTSAMAADACEVVLCMYGKTTGNSGSSECHSAERAFFNIVKENKHGFLPDHTADARKSFYLNVFRQTRRQSVRSSVNMAAFVVNSGETGTEHDGFQVLRLLFSRIKERRNRGRKMSSGQKYFRGLRSEIIQAPRLTCKQPRPRGFCRPGSRINFAAPASESCRPRQRFIWGIARTPSQLSLRPKPAWRDHPL